VALEPGDSTIEILVQGYQSGDWEYVDFARVTVHRGLAMDLTASPPTQQVDQGESAVFTIEVANLGAVDLDTVTVAVSNPGGRLECEKDIPSLPGLSTHTYDCSLRALSEPGVYQYEISALGSVTTTGQTIERYIFTQITVGEVVTPVEVDGIIGALNRVYQIEFGYPGEASEATSTDQRWSQYLAPSPAPLQVFSVGLTAPVYVGVYGTPGEAQAALAAAADVAAAQVMNRTGDGVHWCDWGRVGLQRTQFHGGDSFVLTFTSKTVDTDSDPGISMTWQPVDGWCSLSEAQVALEEPATIVEWSSEEIVWVQGSLLVALRPAWGPQTAERLYTELQGVLP